MKNIQSYLREKRAQGKLLRGSGACAESFKDDKGLTRQRRTLISERGSSTDEGWRQEKLRTLLGFQEIERVWSMGKVEVLKRSEDGKKRVWGWLTGGLTCFPTEIELQQVRWKATDGIEAGEGHCDGYAFEENFGSNVADGLEWGKSRGRKMVTKFIRGRVLRV